MDETNWRRARLRPMYSGWGVSSPVLTMHNQRAACLARIEEAVNRKVKHLGLKMNAKAQAWRECASGVKNLLSSEVDADTYWNAILYEMKAARKHIDDTEFNTEAVSTDKQLIPNIPVLRCLENHRLKLSQLTEQAEYNRIANQLKTRADANRSNEELTKKLTRQLDIMRVNTGPDQHWIRNGPTPTETKNGKPLDGYAVDNAEMEILYKHRFCSPIFERRFKCPKEGCNEMMDVYGDHCWVCMKDGDRTRFHNDWLRTFARMYNRGIGSRATVEENCGFDGQERPADVLIKDLGKKMEMLDGHITNVLRPCSVGVHRSIRDPIEATMKALEVSSQRKRRNYANNLGYNKKKYNFTAGGSNIQGVEGRGWQELWKKIGAKCRATTVANKKRKQAYLQRIKRTLSAGKARNAAKLILQRWPNSPDEKTKEEIKVQALERCKSNGQRRKKRTKPPDEAKREDRYKGMAAIAGSETSTNVESVVVAKMMDMGLALTTSTQTENNEEKMQEVPKKDELNTSEEILTNNDGPTKKDGTSEEQSSAEDDNQPKSEQNRSATTERLSKTDKSNDKEQPNVDEPTENEKGVMRKDETANTDQPPTQRQTPGPDQPEPVPTKPDPPPEIPKPPPQTSIPEGAVQPLKTVAPTKRSTRTLNTQQNITPKWTVEIPTETQTQVKSNERHQVGSKDDKTEKKDQPKPQQNRTATTERLSNKNKSNDKEQSNMVEVRANEDGVTRKEERQANRETAEQSSTPPDDALPTTTQSLKEGMSDLSPRLLADPNEDQLAQHQTLPTATTERLSNKNKSNDKEQSNMVEVRANEDGVTRKEERQVNRAITEQSSTADEASDEGRNMTSKEEAQVNDDDEMGSNTVNGSHTNMPTDAYGLPIDDDL